MADEVKEVVEEKKKRRVIPIDEKIAKAEKKEASSPVSKALKTASL